MTADGLDTSRAGLCARLGDGARYDSPAAPHGMLSAMRLARAGCTRQISLKDDRSLECRETALSVASVACLARLIAEGIERLVGHPGLEGGDAGRAADVRIEVASASNLPGRALRALYFHTLQHLDVAFRDLEKEGWRASFVLPGLDVATPEDAVRIISEALRKCHGDLVAHAVPADKPSIIQSGVSQ